MGSPGTGRSTVSLQFAATAASRGDHAAVFTFEESRELRLDRCSALGIAARQATRVGRIAVRQIDLTEVTLGEFSRRLRHAVTVGGARVVVIDSLNGYMNAMPKRRAVAVQL
jgi:circadian clock protein KaiC